MCGKKPEPGDKVILTGLPPGFLDDLPTEEQRAISRRVGTAIRLYGYDEDGRAELRFRAKAKNYHTLWVSPELIRPIKHRK